MRWSILGKEVTTWGYESQLPAPLLRATAGDLVEVTLVNQLPEATSVHWHGLAIANAMDGVPAVTQPDIEPGSQFRYLFTFPMRALTGSTRTTACSSNEGCTPRS